jgi:hypothetical protein
MLKPAVGGPGGTRNPAGSGLRHTEVGIPPNFWRIVSAQQYRHLLQLRIENAGGAIALDATLGSEMREPTDSAATWWRLSAILGTVAVLGSVGVFAAATMADLRFERPAVASDPSLASKGDNLASAFASQKPDPQSSGWEFDFDWLKNGTPAALVEDRKPGRPDDQAGGLVAAVPIAQPDQPVWQSARPVLESDWTGREITPALAGPSVQHPDRVRRDRKLDPPRAAAPKLHRLAMRPTYLERSVEEGDAGEVTFHLRRRACTPPHMVDVCFMPAENRRSIVVERY